MINDSTSPVITQRRITIEAEWKPYYSEENMILTNDWIRNYGFVYQHVNTKWQAEVMFHHKVSQHSTKEEAMKAVEDYYNAKESNESSK